MEITLTDSLVRIQTLCAGLSQPQAETKPTLDAWSISEILEHLALVERATLIGIKRALSQPESDSEALAQTTTKSEVISVRLTNRAAKMQSPERVLPSGRFGHWPAPFNAFLDSRNALLEFESKEDNRLDTRILPHPVLGPLTLRQWFAFTAAHTIRHGLQIEEILLAQ